MTVALYGLVIMFVWVIASTYLTILLLKIINNAASKIEKSISKLIWKEKIDENK